LVELLEGKKISANTFSKRNWMIVFDV